MGGYHGKHDKLSENVIIVEYQDSWKHSFQSEAQAIFHLLGEYCIGIHHVGSTSVPGMAAKPIIDMMIEFSPFPPDSEIISRLSSLDYECMGECGVPGRCWFRKGEPRCFHLHAVAESSKILHDALRFRDYLIAHPEARHEYATIKRQAAFGQDIDSTPYNRAKQPFIQQCLNMTMRLDEL